MFTTVFVRLDIEICKISAQTEKTFPEKLSPEFGKQYDLFQNQESHTEFHCERDIDEIWKKLLQK